jgi:hypothetical protein
MRHPAQNCSSLRASSHCAPVRADRSETCATSWARSEVYGARCCRSLTVCAPGEAAKHVSNPIQSATHLALWRDSGRGCGQQADALGVCAEATKRPVGRRRAWRRQAFRIHPLLRPPKLRGRRALSQGLRGLSHPRRVIGTSLARVQHTLQGRGRPLGPEGSSKKSKRREFL